MTGEGGRLTDTGVVVVGRSESHLTLAAEAARVVEALAVVTETRVQRALVNVCSEQRASPTRHLPVFTGRRRNGHVNAKLNNNLVDCLHHYVRLTIL